jgi:anti-sigma factor RsiW
MVVDPKSPEAIARLNALIDGELPPAEHAALADRIAAGRDLAHAHATLARLKACIVESAEGTPVVGIVLPSPARRRPMRAAGVALAAAASVLLAVLVWLPEREDMPSSLAEIAPVITLAALPDTPVIPDLAVAGLKLMGGEVERAGGTAVLVVAYRGPRGCRLELRVRPAGADVPPTVGTSRKTWTAGDLAYELVAFGMPAARFAAVAAAAQTATRGPIPKDADRRLREANLQAPPCTG